MLVDDVKKAAVILAFAFVGWAACGAVIGIGMSVTTEENTLIVHAILAPIILAVLSYVYHTRFGYTRPLQTAILFTAIIMSLDFVVVALIIYRSLEMFTSVLGTWLPFAEIFAATYLTGLYLSGKKKSIPTASGSVKADQ